MPRDLSRLLEFFDPDGRFRFTPNGRPAPAPREVPEPLTWEDGQMSEPRVQVLTKPGCHLCETAVAVVAEVTGELGVGFEEVDITADEALFERYWEQIPVTLVDGAQ